VPSAILDQANIPPPIKKAMTTQKLTGIIERISIIIRATQAGKKPNHIVLLKYHL
jgi:hypothetical protein